MKRPPLSLRTGVWRGSGEGLRAPLEILWKGRGIAASLALALGRDGGTSWHMNPNHGHGALDRAG